MQQNKKNSLEENLHTHRRTPLQESWEVVPGLAWLDLEYSIGFLA